MSDKEERLCANCDKPKGVHGSKMPYPCPDQSWSNYYEFKRPADTAEGGPIKLPVSQRDDGKWCTIVDADNKPIPQSAIINALNSPIAFCDNITANKEAYRQGKADADADLTSQRDGLKTVLAELVEAVAKNEKDMFRRTGIFSNRLRAAITAAKEAQ